jgi:hypothetical protein
MSSFLFADDSEFFDAVKNNDPEQVIFLILQGQEINICDEEIDMSDVVCFPPVYYAVINGYIEITEILIKAGANVNEVIPLGPLPPYPYSLVVYALMNGQDEMADFLMQQGANPEDIQKYYQYYFDKYVSQNDITSVQKILENGRFEIEHGLLFYLQYQGGSVAMQQIINNSLPGFRYDNSQLLNALLELEGENFHSRFSIPKPVFPIADSFLKDDNNPLRYNEEKAFDNELSTSWVEGVEGPGIGEKIAFAIEQTADQISIFPGYGEDQYYLPNNRLKKAVLTIYAYQYIIPQTGDAYTVEKLISWELEFNDSQSFQNFPISIPETDFESIYFGVLEIREVYPGTRWDDTCIAEIRIR